MEDDPEDNTWKEKLLAQKKKQEVTLPYELEDDPEDNTTDDEKPPYLIDHGGYDNSDNQSDDYSLPNYLIRGIMNSDDDDSSIESMGDEYLSDDGFFATREFLAQERKQELILPYVLEDEPEDITRKEKFLAQEKKQEVVLPYELEDDQENNTHITKYQILRDVPGVSRR